MEYFAVVSFDLQDADWQDYEVAYAELGWIGFSRTIVGDDGRTAQLPTTTCAGLFNGASAEEVRRALYHQVVTGFQLHGFRSEVFVSVGSDWGWILGGT